MLISNIWSQIYSRFTKDLNAKEKTKQNTAVFTGKKYAWLKIQDFKIEELSKS